MWKPKPDPITHNPETGWTMNSRRTGVLAKKLGMSGDWNEWGQRLPLTFLQVKKSHKKIYHLRLHFEQSNTVLTCGKELVVMINFVQHNTFFEYNFYNQILFSIHKNFFLKSIPFFFYLI